MIVSDDDDNIKKKVLLLRRYIIQISEKKFKKMTLHLNLSKFQYFISYINLCDV